MKEGRPPAIIPILRMLETIGKNRPENQTNKDSRFGQKPIPGSGALETCRSCTN